MRIKRNYFGQEMPEIRDIARDDTLRGYIKKTLTGVLKALEVSSPAKAADKLMGLAGSCTALSLYESVAHGLLEQNRAAGRIPKKLDSRANKIYRQIKPYLPKHYGSVLDLGCGDGRLGKKIAKSGLEVALADIYKSKKIRSLEPKMEFANVGQDGYVPFSRQFDAVLLNAVLHHSNDPQKTLKEAKRLAKDCGSIIVLESVYGIDDNSEFGKLGNEGQKSATAFFDHFYNRIIHYSNNPEEKVNIPGNFNTPTGWMDMFRQNGLSKMQSRHLGMDQPLVPVYHTLHILEHCKPLVGLEQIFHMLPQ